MKMFKEKLSDSMKEKIGEIQYRMKSISEEEVLKRLNEGELKAREQAEKTIKEVK